MSSEAGHGGKRKGAGRKPGPLGVLSIPETVTDPLEFLEAVMTDVSAPAALRVRAGIAAAQYRHRKIGEGGKKDEKGRAADSAGKGKFAPAAPPRLVVNNRN